MTRTQTALHYAGICCASVVIAFTLGYAGPAIDHIAELDDTLAVADQAERAAAQQERLKAALRAMCGENAHAEQIDKFTYRCVTKRGFKTELTARVQL